MDKPLRTSWLPARRFLGAAASVSVLAVIAALAFAQPAAAAPPPLAAPPAAHQAGDSVVVRDGTGPLMRVEVVAPGIAVYQGLLTDSAGDLRTVLPSGTSPTNLDFLSRVQLMIHELESTPSGARLVQALGRLRLMPDPGGTQWGTAGGWHLSDGSTSSINVVIGVADPADESDMRSTELDEAASSSGRGSASFLSIDPRFPSYWAWSNGSRFMMTPVATFAHELGHSLRALMGASIPTTVLDNETLRLDSVPVPILAAIQREELYVVGNPNTEIQHPATAAAPESYSRLDPDTALSRSVSIIRALIADYQQAGDQTTAARLSPIEQTRSDIAGSFPTEYAVTRELGLLPRTHYGTWGIQLEEAWAIEGDPATWIANQRHFTSPQQLNPAAYPYAIRRLPNATVALCGARTASHARCKPKTYFASTPMQWRSQGAGLCLRARDMSRTEVVNNVAEIMACDDKQADQKWTYHPDTKMLSIGDQGLTEYQKAPNAPAMCLTADRIMGDYARLKPCDVNNLKQRWAYTTTGMWMAVNSKGQPFGCLNLYKNERSAGTPTVIGQCDHADNATWNVASPITSFASFKIASASTGAIAALTGTPVPGYNPPSSVLTTLTNTSDLVSTAFSLGPALTSPEALTYFMIEMPAQGYCLTWSTPDSGMVSCNLSKGPTSYSRAWTFYQLSDGRYVIQSSYQYLSAHCLIAPTSAGTNLQAEQCSNAPKDNSASKYRWRILPTWAVNDSPASTYEYDYS